VAAGIFLIQWGEKADLGETRPLKKPPRCKGPLTGYPRVSVSEKDQAGAQGETVAEN